MLATNFISDLEKAIDQRSAQTGAMLHDITDLFLLNAGHYSADQVNLYDKVLKLLIVKVDETARAKLAQRMCATGQAPRNTVRSLALDESIEVAEPVLAQSSVLDDEFLVDCIAKRGQKHLLAIATRNSVSETVSARLIDKGDRNVLTAVANNPGAKISDPSFGVLVEKSVGDDWLSECIALRTDIPDHHFRQLVDRASETVRQRLIGDDPHRLQLINAVLPPSRPFSSGKLAEKPRDYRTAELVVRSQPITEPAVVDFAKAKRIEEMFVAISELSRLSVHEVERIFTGAWSSPVAVILKAIGFHLGTLQIIYGATIPGEATSQMDLIRVKAEFIALRRVTAERILRFYQIRRTTEISERN